MRKGFTLIELMIVIAIIAIIAAIAIPNLLESRVTANESAASASLKAGVFAGQVQFGGAGYLDRDQDNVGEYGTLQQLAGLEATSKNPTGQIRLLTGPMSSANVWVAGVSPTQPGHGLSSGFHFSAIAPTDTDALEATEQLAYDGFFGTDLVASTTSASANQGERVWAAAAVPQEWGNTGRRLFTISVDGQLRSPANPAVQNEIYSGSTNGIPNGTKPSVGGATLPGAANARAIASMIGTAPVTQAAAANTAPNMDGAVFNGFPVYAK